MHDRDEQLSEWLKAYGDLINRTCFLILGDRALAEDATQETFLRAWKSMAQFKGDASPKTWLTRIAINVCRNIRRTAWFRRNDRCITPEDLPLTAPQRTGRCSSWCSSCRTSTGRSSCCATTRA